MKIPLESVRLDRWLTAVRFYKTRTQAAKACEGHKVKVNGIAAKPHKFLHIGDKLIIHHHGQYRNIEVLGLAQRGLPPKEAKKLYQEDPKNILSKASKEILLLYRETEKKFQTKFKGRPTKRERRQIEKLKGKL